MPTAPDTMICNAPNQFARPAELQLDEHSAAFRGYQEFFLTRCAIHVLPEDPGLKVKKALLTPFFAPRFLKERSLLDLGANAGFFCFWALQNGADRAIAVDMDENYLRMIEEARARLGFNNLDTVKANVAEWNEPADIVLALALVHWIYSCTAAFGDLNLVIEKLAQLTKHLLIVEWVEPNDPAIGFFHHTDWNKELARGPYALEAFESALSRHFPRVERLGEVTPTRLLYAAFRHRNEIDLSGPMPFVTGRESVICSRYLAKANGIGYWSRLYDTGDAIHKQGTLDLAQREGSFLAGLGSAYFPRLLSTASTDDYSLIAIEKIQGIPLREGIQAIVQSSIDLHRFIEHCLAILAELKRRGIAHRDIRLDNLMLRQGAPVLIDFGWAVSDECRCITPEGLGSAQRPPDGSFCDVYSMGKVFAEVNQHRYPRFDPVIELMTEPDASLRITDPEILRALFAYVAADAAEDGGEER